MSTRPSAFRLSPFAFLRLLSALLAVVMFVSPAVAAPPGPAAYTPYFKSNLTATAVLVSASPVPGRTYVTLGGYNISNVNVATVYVQFFDAAAASDVTLGTTVPTAVLAIPANGVIDGTLPPQPGLAFSRGIVIAATTTSTGLTAPASALPTTLYTSILIP